MMMKKIEQTIRKYSLLERGDCVVVALSGGADSCALLISLNRLAESLCLKIIVAHFNHGLRQDESDNDEAFCHALAQKFGLPFVTKKMHQTVIPQGMSPEDYFRRERYRFLDDAATRYGANKIALGHHLHDQAETVLINVLRGSGLDGLKGFLPMRQNKYIRPLMEVTRREIHDYLNKTGIEYREDSSNNSKVYLRNLIRNDLIPQLKEKYNPQIEQNLARMAEIIRRDDEFISKYVHDILSSTHIKKNDDEVFFSAEYFKTLPPSLGYRVLKALLEGLTPDGRGVSYAHIQSLAGLVNQRSSGKTISLPNHLIAQKEYDRIIIKTNGIEEKHDFEYIMKIPGEIALRERNLLISVRKGTAAEINFNHADGIYFDGDKIREPLIIRNRRKGDWFEPLGTRGSQKIKQLFIDRKVPRQQRERLALIADQVSVIWIENMHLCERVKISAETINILNVEILPLT